MGFVRGQWEFAFALVYLLFVTFIYGLEEIPTHLGQTASLTCRGHPDSVGLRLTRADLEPLYVFFYRDNRPDPTRQSEQFKDRVTLPDLVMDDAGNVVVHLSNVTWSDQGTYVCTVYKSGGDPVETSFAVRVVDPDEGATATPEPPNPEAPTSEAPTPEPQAEDPTVKPKASINYYMVALLPQYTFAFLVALFVAYILLKDRLRNEENQEETQGT